MNDNINEIGNILEYSPLTDGAYESYDQKRMRVTGEPLNNIISDKEQGKGI